MPDSLQSTIGRLRGLLEKAQIEGPDAWPRLSWEAVNSLPALLAAVERAESLEAANLSVSVCAEHTADVTTHPGCLVCDLNQLFERLQAAVRRGERLAEFVRFLSVQGCDLTGDEECSSPELCLTEFCWPCAARVHLAAYEAKEGE